MNQYYLWCVLNDGYANHLGFYACTREDKTTDKLHKGSFHASSPQEAWGHFLDDLNEQGVEEKDILFRGGCEVREQDCLASVVMLSEADLYDDRH
jgi:hypothetical protein